MVDPTIMNHPSLVVGDPSAVPVCIARRDDSNHSGLTAPARSRRILHLINGEHYSGAERVQDLLALRLKEFGYEVGFGCLKPDKFPLSRACRDAALFATPMRGRFDLRVVQRLAGIVRQEGFCLIHAHTPRTLMLGMLLKGLTQLPLVYHIHSPTSRDSTRRFQNWVNTRIESVGIRAANRLITVSESLARFTIAQGVDQRRISVVHNGVPRAPVVRMSTPPSEPWTVGTVALFRPRKGLEVLVDSAAILRQQGLPIRIRAVGPFETESYQRQILDRVEAQGLAGQICWTGFTRDVHSEFAKMDLFALPSLFGEGLPMVVLESMSAGVPVVGTLVEGVPEAVRDGFDGVLARPNDAQSFADAIRRAMFDYDWTTLRTNAMRRHAECFSDTAMAAGVARTYDELLVARGMEEDVGLPGSPRA